MVLFVKQRHQVAQLRTLSRYSETNFLLLRSELEILFQSWARLQIEETMYI